MLKKKDVSRDLGERDKSPQERFIIFTIGRTGSSLLVNILNKYNNVTFAGEIYNLNLLRRINDNKEIRITDFKIFDHKYNKKIGVLSTHALYFPKNTNYFKYFEKQNIFMEEFNSKNGKLEKIKYIMPEDEKVGLKILTTSKNIEFFLEWDISKYFKIILLIRENTNSLRKSMKKAGFYSYKTVNLKKENDKYREIYKNNKMFHNIFLLSYEDMLKNTNNFKNLFEFLNIKTDDKLIKCGFNEICSFASSLN